MSGEAANRLNAWRRSRRSPADAVRPLNVAELAQESLAALDRRSTYLPKIQYEDPQWRIVLNLVIARECGEALSVSYLCQCSAVPTTTALRHIACLETNGIIVRSSNPRDGRSSMLALHDFAYRQVAKYLLSLGTPAD